MRDRQAMNTTLDGLETARRTHKGITLLPIVHGLEVLNVATGGPRAQGRVPPRWGIRHQGGAGTRALLRAR